MKKLGMKVKLDPESAKREIFAAFRKSGCHLDEAASQLNESRSSVLRWIRVLKIRVEVDAMREQAKLEGWHHNKKGGSSYHVDKPTRAAKARATIAAKKTVDVDEV